MVIERKKEELSLLGSKKISFDGLHQTAAEQEKGWQNMIISGQDMQMSSDAQISYLFHKPLDVTDNAFGQFCNIKGVPVAYAKKCMQEEKLDLMRVNFDAWPVEGNYMLRNYTDVNGIETCNAIVSEKYTPISNNQVLDLVEQSVDLDRYICNQAFLSPEKLHIRMVDFDHPITTPNDSSSLYAGFCVNNNEVGAGTLSVKFFIYRFACKNGIVRTAAGGTMFQQRHIGINQEDMMNFAACFDKMQVLRDNAVKDILAAQNKTLSVKEMDAYLEKVKRELHLSKNMFIEEENGQQIEAVDWIQSNYGNNLWGVVNFVTEKAKRYTLETRIEAEQYADRLLAAA